MNITRWILVVGAGVLVLVWLEVRKPEQRAGAAGPGVGLL